MKNTFFTLFIKVLDILNGVTTVIIALAVVGFMWGIVKTLFQSDNEVAKKEGRSFMVYGILTLFVMTSLWGLVNILNGTVLPNVYDPNTNRESAAENFDEGSETDDFDDLDRY